MCLSIHAHIQKDGERERERERVFNKITENKLTRERQAVLNHTKGSNTCKCVVREETSDNRTCLPTFLRQCNKKRKLFFFS